MIRRQRGVTFIGWLILLIPVAILGYVGIRLVPIYLNYMRVTKALGQAVSEGKGADAGTAQLMRNSLEKRFDIEGIEHPTFKDVDIHREGDHWVAVIDYEDLAPMFGNVSLLVQFHKELQVP